MNTAIIVMTILGCTDAADACEYVRTVERRFETDAQCQAQVERELKGTGSSGYPTVVAFCETPAEMRTRMAEQAKPAAPQPVELASEPRKPDGVLSAMGDGLKKTGKTIVAFTRSLSDGIRRVFVRKPAGDDVLASEFVQQ